MRRLTQLIALFAVLSPGTVFAQLRHRRPVASAPDIRYGFDNNGGGGCRDYNCGSRCYDGHSGTDIPIGVGTEVLASAGGTVTATNNGCANTGYVGNPCGGRCGNYVQLSHSDGSVTIYCHMQLNSLRVSRGQRVSCGQVLGRSASSGSSSGPHLHFGWRRSSGSASQDPFRGRCSSGPVVWTEQRPYPGISGSACACVPSPESCNNRDDDCDGRIDDGLSRSCYTGPSGTSGRGTCRAGTQTCSAGRWGECNGQVLPRAETCDDRDTDCDGRVDDGLTRMCYTGPAGTSGRGVCRGGTQTCRAGAWGSCAGQVVPRAETCDRSDEDCDGMTDEGGVCDAGARPDVVLRDAAGDDVTDVLIEDDAASEDDAAVEVDAVGEDASVSDDVEEVKDAEFEDLGPEEDADLGFDREDPTVTGCDCRAGARSTPRGGGGMLLFGLVAARRRRRAIG